MNKKIIIIIVAIALAIIAVIIIKKKANEGYVDTNDYIEFKDLKNRKGVLGLSALSDRNFANYTNFHDHMWLNDCPCGCGDNCQCDNNCECECFNRKMILQWVYHLLYTRLVLMKFFSNSSLSELSSRLLQNQKDIGNLFRVKFGDKVASNITQALTEHINIAVKVLTDLKTKKDPSNDLKLFYKNANDIGMYLDNLFNLNVFTKHMKNHIDTLVNNIQAYIKEDNRNDIGTLDKYVKDTLDMGMDLGKKVGCGC